MKAVGYKTPGPIDAEQSLVDVSLPEPTPSGRDLLVEVRAISVNPVDYNGCSPFRRYDLSCFLVAGQ